MKLSVTHTFDCTPDQLWDIFDRDEFEKRLGDASSVEREVLERRDEGKERYKKTRCTSRRDYPAMMKKALGGAEVVYDQETWLDRSTNRLRWKITPHVLPGKIFAEGTTVIEPKGGKCVRTIAGEIRVSVPLIGGKVEKMIVSSVEESYSRAADIAREMLAEDA